MEVTPGKPLGANTSEGVLANFFNSLLSKKTGGGVGGGVGASPGSAGLAGASPGARSGVSPQPDECKCVENCFIESVEFQVYELPFNEYRKNYGRRPIAIYSYVP